jgi:hypothetical protein
MCDLHYSHKLIMLNISVLHERIDINMTYTYDGDQPASLPMFYTICPGRPMSILQPRNSNCVGFAANNSPGLHRWSKNKGCPSSDRCQPLAPPWPQCTFPKTVPAPLAEIINHWKRGVVNFIPSFLPSPSPPQLHSFSQSAATSHGKFILLSQ